MHARNDERLLAGMLAAYAVTEFEVGHDAVQVEVEVLRQWAALVRLQDLLRQASERVVEMPEAGEGDTGQLVARELLERMIERPARGR